MLEHLIFWAATPTSKTKRQHQFPISQRLGRDPPHVPPHMIDCMCSTVGEKQRSAIKLLLTTLAPTNPGGYERP
jgi:hypothetical protein